MPAASNVNVSAAPFVGVSVTSWKKIGVAVASLAEPFLPTMKPPIVSPAAIVGRTRSRRA
jgi:hypothetical protein